MLDSDGEVPELIGDPVKLRRGRCRPSRVVGDDANGRIEAVIQRGVPPPILSVARTTRLVELHSPTVARAIAGCFGPEKRPTEAHHGLLSASHEKASTKEFERPHRRVAKGHP